MSIPLPATPGDCDGPVPSGAAEHLIAADPVLARIIEQVGSLEIRLERDYWWSLVESIVGQQLSVAAAATIVRRVAALAPGDERPTPQMLLAQPDEVLRAKGLSRAKINYIRDLATRWLDGSIQHERLHELSDDEVVEELVQVKGIGRWTAEMFLIFSLGRPDVFPVDDLGIRVAVQIAYGLSERPGRAELLEIGERWAPYRTAASLYLWRSRRLPVPDGPQPAPAKGRAG